MHIGTEQWTSGIEAVTREFMASFQDFTQSEWNWKPDPATWSIAQVVDHIIRVNESYFPVFAALQQGTYHPAWPARFPFLVRFFGSLVLNGVEPSRRKKTRTFQVWEPALRQSEGNILEQFSGHQQELAAMIRSCGPYLKDRVVIGSPANKFIVYRLETAFDILLTHERRHLNQALALKERIKS